jgi:hypothetical protein
VPLTVSHVAAVVPLMSRGALRRYLDPWTLALGSMAPDLTLCVPALGLYRHWHSPTGVLLYSIPVTLALFVFVQWVCRDPITALLPPAAAGKVAALPRPSWRRLPALAAGAMVGFASHVLWDSFTHSWHARYWDWAWLGAPIADGLPVHRALQILSSVVGLGVLAWWASRGLARREPRAVPGHLLMRPAVRRAVAAMVALSACAGAVCWPMVIDPPRTPGLMATAVKTIIGAGAGCVVFLVGYAVLWQAARLVRGTEVGDPGRA